MFLPTFNLPNIIQSYNQQKNKMLESDENFGCVYLNRELLTHCRELTDLINNSAELFLFSSDETSLLQDRRQKINAWRLEAKNIDSIKKIFDRFKLAYSISPAIIAKSKLNEWRKQQYLNFEDIDNWINLASENISVEQIEELKNNWKEQILFVRHSVRSIFNIAHDWLPQLIAYHEAALTNLKWHYFFIPNQVYYAYKNYLEVFLKQAQQLKVNLAAAMFQRLKIFSDTDFMHADTIIYVAEKLQIDHPVSDEKLTNEEFLNFHRYINQNINAQNRKNISGLKWLKSNNNLNLKVVSTKKNILLIPAILSQDVPSKRRKPNFLFANANLRYELCEKNSLNFVMLQQLPEMPRLNFNELKTNDLKNILNRFKNRQELVVKMKLEIERAPFNKISMIHWRMNRFLRNYKQLLASIELNTIEPLLSYAEQLASNLLSQENEFLIIQQQTYEISLMLQDLLQSLQISVADSKNNVLQKRLKRIHDQTAEITACNQVLHLLQKVEQGKIISEVELNYVKTILIHTNMVTNSKWKEYLIKLSKIILQNLLQELKLNPYKILVDDEQNAHYFYIQQCCQILQVTAPQYDFHVIEKPLSKYFLAYLNVVLKCGLEKEFFNVNASTLDVFERVINLFSKAKEIFIGDVSIVKCLEYLKCLRNEKNWHELQAEAESLACMLGDKLLINHVDKVCERLDSQLKGLVRENRKYFGSDNEIADHIIFKARDQLVTTGKQKLDESVTTDLKLHEQVLVGVKSYLENDSLKRKFIPTIIELSSQARQFQHDFANQELTYYQRAEKVFNYQETIDKENTNIKKYFNLQDNLIGCSKSPVSFFKSYVAMTQFADITADINLATKVKRG